MSLADVLIKALFKLLDNSTHYQLQWSTRAWKGRDGKVGQGKFIEQERE